MKGSNLRHWILWSRRGSIGDKEILNYLRCLATDDLLQRGDNRAKYYECHRVTRCARATSNDSFTLKEKMNSCFKWL